MAGGGGRRTVRGGVGDELKRRKEGKEGKRREKKEKVFRWAAAAALYGSFQAASPARDYPRARNRQQPAGQVCAPRKPAGLPMLKDITRLSPFVTPEHHTRRAKYS